MSLSTDIKFAGMASVWLERYTVKQTSPYLAACRCPICGDSKKNKSKTRMYFIQNDDRLSIKCHNCGWIGNMVMLLEHVSPSMADQYKMENFDEKFVKKRRPKKSLNTSPIKSRKPNFSKKPEIEKKFLAMSEPVSKSQVAIEYLESRSIPEDLYKNFRVMDDISKLVEIAPKYKGKIFKERRLIIPIRNRRGELIGVTCRAFGKSSRKYIMVKFSDEDLIYGIDKVDFNRPIIVVEGPIDSMLVENACAANGTALAKVVKEVGANSILVFDNQPRNPEVVDIIFKYAKAGHKLFVWEDKFSACKDINNVRESFGFDRAQMTDIIKSNSYKGMRLMLELAHWKKFKKSGKGK